MPNISSFRFDLSDSSTELTSTWRQGGPANTVFLSGGALHLQGDSGFITEDIQYSFADGDSIQVKIQPDYVGPEWLFVVSNDTTSLFFRSFNDNLLGPNSYSIDYDQTAHANLKFVREGASFGLYTSANGTLWTRHPIDIAVNNVDGFTMLLSHGGDITVTDFFGSSTATSITYVKMWFPE